MNLDDSKHGGRQKARWRQYNYLILGEERKEKKRSVRSKSRSGPKPLFKLGVPAGLTMALRRLALESRSKHL